MPKKTHAAFCFLLCFLLSTPLCAQRIKVRVKKTTLPTLKIQPRIKGADISKYAPPSKLWAQTYRLNQKFLNGIKPERSGPVFLPDNLNLPPWLYAHFKGLSLKASKAVIHQHLISKLKWIQQQPGRGKPLLKEVNGAEIDYNFYKKLSGTNLVFVGEIHKNLPPRLAFANLIGKFKRLYYNRKIVVFSEAAYLKPIAGERVFPYQYYRRGAEGVEGPINFAEKGNPNTRLVENKSLQFEKMFSVLLDSGVEIYPVEDAVVVQKEVAQGIISTVGGLAERNKGFARTMQAQMEKIRLKYPDALFIYYGGMAHTSWAMPVSLPKFFAKENPLVVELITEKDIEKTFSLLPAVWEKGHPAFSKTGIKRMFLWQGPAGKTREWGKASGFDCRIIIP